jgi:mono/diheme cytochrome c family protein
MKRVGHGLQGLFVALIVSVAFAPACSHMKYGFASNPVDVSEASLGAGKALYETHCASCHGNKGKGDGPEASALPKPPTQLATAQREWSDGVFHIRMIGSPKNGMPSFKQTLTETERWQVIRYVRSFDAK